MGHPIFLEKKSNIHEHGFSHLSSREDQDPKKNPNFENHTIHLKPLHSG